jgi:hypothetical protein
MSGSFHGSRIAINARKVNLIRLELEVVHAEKSPYRSRAQAGFSFSILLLLSIVWGDFEFQRTLKLIKVFLKAPPYNGSES